MKLKTRFVLAAPLMSLAAAFSVALAPTQGFAQGASAATSAGGDIVGDLMTGAKAGAVLRAVSFSRTKPNNTGPSAEAIGAGGWLFGETGEIAKTLSFGGAAYGIAKVSGPDRHGGNFVLKDDPPGQEGYALIGEAWGRLRFGEQAVTAGRVSPNLGWYLDGVYRFNRNDSAFLGRRDFRGMLPLSFEAALATGKLAQDTVRYYGGYVWEMRQVNQNTFKNLATGALLPGDSDGMAFAGGGWKINNDLMLQGGYHAVSNVMNIGWGDLDYMYRIAKDKYVRLDVQYINQNSNGTAVPFSTSSRAAYLEARPLPWWIPYGLVGRTGDGQDLRSPYSLGPSYLIQRVGENAWAGEHTWILGSTFDFGTFGVPGLSFDANYGQRTDRHLPGDASKPLADWTETATDLVYVFGKDAGLLSGMRLRARWARVWLKGNNFAAGRITDITQQLDDVRLDVSWLIQFK